MRHIQAIAVALLLATPTHAADAPYEAKLLRLSEILGSVHFLRSLCGEQGTSWRDSMMRILDAEKPEDARKATLTAAFNHGYRSFDGVYVRCTQQATDAIKLFMKEGEALAEDIASRYGN